MKKLIFVSLATFSFYAEACQDKIKSDRYMLFVDTNNSELEIATAEKAACARGEKMIVVPKNYKDYSKVIKDFETASKAVQVCSRQKKDCTELARKFTDSYNAMNAFRGSQPPMKNATEEALKEIRANKGKLQNFIISGHDGGGSFGGNKGHFSRGQLGKMMSNFKDINDVSTIMLLGCYTGVQKEIMEWQNIFPKARMIGGYDDSAPLSDKPVGHQFITELLTKEKALLTQADGKRLKEFAKSNIKSLVHLNAAVYVDCGEKTGDEFYYSSKQRAKHFAVFDAKECLTKGKEMDDIVNAIRDFDFGEKEPPTNTASGEIRQLYIKARNLEHCEEYVDRKLDVNKIFNLLFYQGVKQSFASFYQEDLATAEKTLADVLKNNPEIWIPNKENLEKKSRKETLENIHKLVGVSLRAGLTAEQKRVTSWLGTVMAHHLQHFQNPFSWHEFVGRAEKPQIAHRLKDFKSVPSSSAGIRLTPTQGGGGFVGGMFGGGQ